MPGKPHKPVKPSKPNHGDLDELFADENVRRVVLKNGYEFTIEAGTYSEEGGMFVTKDTSDPNLLIAGRVDEIAAVWFEKPAEPPVTP